MEYIEIIQCLICGWPEASIVHEPKYNGFRGKCQKCDNNWPES